MKTQSMALTFGNGVRVLWLRRPMKSYEVIVYELAPQVISKKKFKADRIVQSIAYYEKLCRKNSKASATG